MTTTFSIGGEEPGAIHATFRLRVADADLAERLATAIASRVSSERARPLPWPEVVRVTANGADVSGRVAVLPLAGIPPTALERLLGTVESAGAAGIQLVWDGVNPPRAIAEAALFAALEKRRGRKGVPLVLALDETPCEALLRQLP